jgi:hypothetical protein
MALRDTFLSVKPREKPGSRSSARSDYQKHWALCQLLKLQSSGADYLIVFRDGAAEKRVRKTLGL